MTSKATLCTFSSHACLIDALLNKLAEIETKDLSKIAIFLPTQRLGSHLLARLARKLGAFLPPKILTLESMIALARKDHEGQAISDAASEFLLNQLIEDGNFSQIRTGHERELRLILGELYNNGIRQSAFQDLKEALRQDIYHDDKHVDSLLTRVQECEDVLNQFEDKISSFSLEAKSRFMAELSQKRDLILDFVASYDSIYMVGYTSVAPSWLPAIDALCTTSKLEVWLSEKPDIYHASSPLEGLIEYFKRHCTIQKDCREPLARGTSAQLVETETPFAEVACAQDLLEGLMEAGNEASQLGVLITNEGQYESICNSLKQSVFENANIAMTRAFKNTDVGRWLEKLIQAVSQETVSSWLDWIRDPHTKHWLESMHDLDVGVFTWNLARSKATSLEMFLKGSVESEALLESIKALSQDFTSGKHPVDYWANATFEWIEKCALPRKDQESDASREALQTFKTTLEQITALSNRLLSRKEYFEFLENHLLNAEVRSIGEPLKGVQVISLAEARYYPFSAVLVLGCNEGTFPKALPKDELLDNYIKKKMGLPGWEVLEAMEDQTFHLLKARIPQLYLLRSRFNSDQATVRSRFIEKLQSENQIEVSKHYLSPEEFWKNRQSYDLETSTLQTSEGSYHSNPDVLWQRVSASSIEKLIRCPYRYLLSKLGVQSLEFTKEDDPRIEGEWLHQVLESFFTGTYEGSTLFTWEREDWDSFESISLQRLDRLTCVIGPSNIQKKPLYFQLLQHSWPSFVKHIMKFYGDSFISLTKGLREAKLGDFRDGTPTIRVRGLLRKCSGSIDSLDTSYGLSMLTDYKRKTIPARSETLKGTSPQLAFYALAIDGLEKDYSMNQLLLGYWNIIKAEWQAHAVGEDGRQRAIDRGLANSRTTDIKDLVEGTLKTWSWREEDIIHKKRFYADPSTCGLCDYSDVCRKEDPRHRLRLEEQNYLDQMIEEKA